MENSTLPQCLCWTVWEMQHRGETRLLPDGCRRDEWVEKHDKGKKQGRRKHLEIFMGQHLCDSSHGSTFKQHLHSSCATDQAFIPMMFAASIFPFSRPTLVSGQTYLVRRHRLRHRLQSRRWRRRRAQASIRRGLQWGRGRFAVSSALRVVSQAAQAAATTERWPATMTSRFPRARLMLVWKIAF